MIFAPLRMTDADDFPAWLLSVVPKHFPSHARNTAHTTLHRYHCTCPAGAQRSASKVCLSLTWHKRNVAWPQASRPIEFGSAGVHCSESFRRGIARRYCGSSVVINFATSMWDDATSHDKPRHRNAARHRHPPHDTGRSVARTPTAQHRHLPSDTGTQHSTGTYRATQVRSTAQAPTARHRHPPHDTGTQRSVRWWLHLCAGECFKSGGLVYSPASVRIRGVLVLRVVFGFAEQGGYPT